MGIELAYRIEGKKRIGVQTDCADYSIESSCRDGIVCYRLIPKRPLELIRFTQTIDRAFTDDERVLENGYQSWTDTVEMGKNDKLRKIGWRNKLYMGNPILNAYGDGDFKKYATAKGCFHSYSYTYVRKGNQYELYGSLNESTGFTTFNFDLRKGKIAVEKDLEGVICAKPYEVLRYAVICDTEERAFDRYFELLALPKPRVKRNCGYTSWYNYYQKISEDIIVRDLKSFQKSPVKMEIFQIDDGYQTAIGDWLSVDPDKFPNGLSPIVDKIHAAGMKAGLWLAPVAAQLTSRIYEEHPDWFVKDKKGKIAKHGGNWGGYCALDVNLPQVRAHLKHVFDVVCNQWGFDMVKLDFLCSSCFYPRDGKSRGQIMCETMDFLRECVGDKLILGCGVPLFPCFGKVDYCRIGPDMGLSWKDSAYLRMTSREDVTTRYAMCNSVFRRQLDGRAFVNDPDVFLLRDSNIQIDMQQRKIIATVNKLFGNLLFVSDDLAEYDDEKRAFFTKIMTDNAFEVTEAYMDADQNMHVAYRFEDTDRKLVFNTIDGRLLDGQTL